MITLCQCNIHDGGKWTGRRQTSATYDTAGRFASFIGSVNPPGSPCPPIALIGMQELMTEDDRLTISGFLEEATGVSWESARTPQGVNNASGIGMLWRPDLVEFRPEWYMGSAVLDQLDNGYIIKFTGRLFRPVDGDEIFGFLTGKLVWESAIIGGRRVTEDDRRQEATRLKTWIAHGDDQSPGCSQFPDVARVIATDLNAGIGSPAWHEMNADYTDPSRQHTFTSFAGSTLMDAAGVRLDYLWLSRNVPAGRTCEFIDGPRRSPHFGSDHRAVYATVAPRAEVPAEKPQNKLATPY